jgi:hypothetical protein
MSKHLESLYENLLNGKLPHNLSWSEAVELVEHLGEVQPHGGDEFAFRVGSLFRVADHKLDDSFQISDLLAPTTDCGLH